MLACTLLPTPGWGLGRILTVGKALWRGSLLTKLPVPVQNNILTLSGQVEHYNLAQRMIKAWGEPLMQTYQPFTYEFQSTAISRAGSSGTSFAYGMFGESGDLPYPKGGFSPIFISSNSLDQDVELHFFDVCPEYVHSVSVRASFIP